MATAIQITALTRPRRDMIPMAGKESKRICGGSREATS